MAGALPDDIKMQLVDVMGAYLSATPAQDLPRGIRRLQGFRARALARHSGELIALLDDETERKLILQSLDDDMLRLPKHTEAVARIALERDEGWEERLTALSELPDTPRTVPGPDYQAQIARERDKAKSARDDARKARASARAEVESEQRRADELARGLSALTERLDAAGAERDLARSELERVRAAVQRSERKIRREREKANAAAEQARAEAKSLRREVTRLTAELDVMKNASKKPRPRTRPTAETAPGKRRQLRVPSGLFAEAPETLDAWLTEPHASLLIDGYNVSKSEGGFGSLRLEDQRTRLIQEIDRLARTRKVPATIVFDGALIGPGTSRRSRRAVRVAYSKPPEVADDHLVAVLSELPLWPVIVVTNDRELQDRCAALDATIARAEQLISLIR